RWLRVGFWALAAPVVCIPLVSSPPDQPQSPELMFCDHSPIWSLRFDSWLLICVRFDHKNNPAAAAPAAAAAAANGRSRAISTTPQSPLRSLFLGINSLLELFRSQSD